jgi:hypothetical protein
MFSGLQAARVSARTRASLLGEPYGDENDDAPDDQ